mgnify:CR=1 FL=1
MIQKNLQVDILQVFYAHQHSVKHLFFKNNVSKHFCWIKYEFNLYLMFTIVNQIQAYDSAKRN